MEDIFEITPFPYSPQENDLRADGVRLAIEHLESQMKIWDDTICPASMLKLLKDNLEALQTLVENGEV